MDLQWGGFWKATAICVHFGSNRINLYYAHMKISCIFTFLSVSFAFAINANEDLGPIIANTAVSQGSRLLPLFALSVSIALFFALIQKNLQKTVTGCGILLGVTFVMGLLVWLLDFIAIHVFAFILLGMGIIFAGLVVYMLYSK